MKDIERKAARNRKGEEAKRTQGKARGKDKRQEAGERGRGKKGRDAVPGGRWPGEGGAAGEGAKAQDKGSCRFRQKQF